MENLNKVITMKRETGNPKFPIWLIGDSEPERWKGDLETPFDPRHPIRHNIWTSIIDVVQDSLYREIGKRINTEKLFIRNAVKDASDKPSRYLKEPWRDVVNQEIQELQQLLTENNPILVFSFGSFSYEFCRRANFQGPERAFTHWDTKHLGDAFRDSIQKFDVNQVDVLPLLHRSIAGGHFLSGHRAFCPPDEDNYFEYAGKQIASLFLKNPPLHATFIK